MHQKTNNNKEETMDSDYFSHFKKVKSRYGMVNTRKPIVNLDGPYDFGKTLRIPNSDSQIAKDPRVLPKRVQNQSNSPSNLEDIMTQITNLRSKQRDDPPRIKVQFTKWIAPKSEEHLEPKRDKNLCNVFFNLDDRISDLLAQKPDLMVKFPKIMAKIPNMKDNQPEEHSQIPNLEAQISNPKAQQPREHSRLDGQNL